MKIPNNPHLGLLQESENSNGNTNMCKLSGVNDFSLFKPET